ncbi:hypothetical protein ACJJIG_18605 [Microbulbifer sp. SSSA007]|uniref:hypothetical protein n=1 Tax=Microbulbifer sp. SSSA007 TaxID=3243379 RepID=UPI00403916CF
MKKIIISFALMIVLTGCAGTKFEFQKARQIEVGMTEAQLTEMMGSPYSVTARGEDQIWVWVEVNPITMASKSVSFILRDGKVREVPKIPESFQ